MSTSSSIDSPLAFYLSIDPSTLTLKEIHERGLEVLGKTGNEFFLSYLEIIVEKEFENPRHFEFHETKVLILNTIAASFLAKAVYEESDESRNERFSKTMHYINKADRIDIQQGISFALKGFLLFYQGQYEKAPRYFDQSLLLKGNYVFAFIGKAVSSFVAKNYSESIRNFSLALQQQEDLPDEIYYGFLGFTLALALAYYFEEDFDSAKVICETLLEIDSENVYYILLKASLCLQSGNIDEYLKLHSNKSTHLTPNFLLNLSEIFLLREKYEKATELANEGLRQLENWPKILKGKEKSEMKDCRLDYFDLKSRLQYIKAYKLHTENNHFEALKLYKEAVIASPMNFAAQFGYGQLLILEKNYIDALKCFEFIHANEKNERVEELYKVLGYLYSKNMKREEAISYYEKAIRFDPNDFESLIEYAGIQEHHDPLSSLKSYQKALEIVISSEEPEPELFNNIGVLKTKLGMEIEAVEDFKMALSICKRRAELEKKYSQLVCTIMFNLAVAYEELCMVGDAVLTLKSLLAENPFYSDAILRLSFLSFKRGSHIKALEYSEAALAKVESTKNGRVDLPLCLKGFLLAENGETDSAKLTFELIKKKYGIDDCYGKLAVSALDYDNVVKLRSQPSEQKRFLRKIIEESKYILMADEHNMQAAMSIAVALAESGYLRESREIFNSLMEISQFNPIILGNVGILEFITRNYDNAIRIISSFNQKTNNQKEMANILSLSYFFKNDYASALKVLKIAILKNPHLMSLRFNFCELLYRISHQTLDNSLRTKENTHHSIVILNKILPIFDFFHTNHLARIAEAALEKSDEARQEKRRQLESIRDKAETRANFIRDYQERFEEILMADEETEKQRKVDKTMTQKIMEKIQMKERKREEIKRSKEESRRRELEEKAQAEMELAKKLLAEIQFEKESKPQKKKSEKGSKKKRHAKAEDLHEDIFGDLDEREDDEDEDFMVGNISENEGSEDIPIPKAESKPEPEPDTQGNPTKKRKLIKNRTRKLHDEEEDNPFAGL